MAATIASFMWGALVLQPLTGQCGLVFFIRLDANMNHLELIVSGATEGIVTFHALKACEELLAA
jgi:hypothetical protein